MKTGSPSTQSADVQKEKSLGADIDIHSDARPGCDLAVGADASPDCDSAIRADTLPGCDFTIFQTPGGFCCGTDTVLLAAFARVRSGQRVLDLGCGTGGISLLLASRSPALFTCVDLDPTAVALLRKSVAHNGLEARFSVLCQDFRVLPGGLPNWRAWLNRPNKAASDCSPHARANGRNPDERALNEAGSDDHGCKSRPLRKNPDGFHVVVCNPPFVSTTSGPLHQTHAHARAELSATMDDVVHTARDALVELGYFYCIYPAARIGELCGTLAAAGFAVKRLTLVQPVADRPPNRVLVAAQKHGKPGTLTEILHTHPH